MKKIKIAGLALLPVLALSGCTGVSPLSFSANWYQNTMVTTVGELSERLEYEVTFTPADSNAAFSLSYDPGTYTTELSFETLTLEDGSTQGGYVYTTELNITGRFTLNGTQGEPFEDFVQTTVKFLPVGNRLQPVESERVTHSTTPLSDSPASLELGEGIQLFYFRSHIAYSADLTRATETFTDLTEENATPVVTEYDISGDSTFLDNRQIEFALRGLDLSAGATFRSINPAASGQSAVQSLTVSATSVEEFVDFTMGGRQVNENIAAMSAQVSYDVSLSGQPQTVVYAATTDAQNNTYRNVMLRMEVPVMWLLGTMQYRLTSAEFTTYG